MYTFVINPMGKPRMVHSDRWNERKCVMEYWGYKDKLVLQARNKNYKVGTGIDIIFFIPMPDSWTKKKQEEMNGKPHQQKPDIDNLLKAFLDSLCETDAHIWTIKAKKLWGTVGSIEVDNI